MTDSKDGQNKFPDHVRAKLKTLRRKPKSEIKTIADLPRWAKTAIVRIEVYGETVSEAAEELGFKGETLSYWRNTAAGKEWSISLRKFADDPIQLAQAFIRGQQFNFTLDYMVLLQDAITFNDRALAEKMLRTLMTSGGSLKTEKEITVPHTIVLQMGNTTLEIPTITSEARQIGPTIDAELIE